MTLDEFLLQLSKTADKFTWSNDDGTYLIRASNARRYYCPITAVCANVTGKYYELGKWRSAAKDIELMLLTAERIAVAADSRFSDQPSVLKLRQRLRRAINTDLKK